MKLNVTSSMKTRIIVGAIGVAVLLPILIFSNTIVFPIAISVLSAIGIYELLNCTHLFSEKVYMVVSILYALFCPIAARLLHGLTTVAITSAVFMLFIMAYSVLSQQTEILARLSSTAFFTLYVVTGFSSMVVIRDLEHGAILMVLALIIAWFTDTFAYFTGIAFGKRKLIPKISPNKTVEGSIGGILVTVVATVIILLGISIFSNNSPRYFLLILFTAVASAMAQIGDLTMSQIKRYYKIKDFGKMLPGHGGVLDRFDSVLATSLTVTVLVFVFSGISLF